MGYLVADALGRPLLAALDARPVGKRIDTKAVAIENQLVLMPKAAAEAARKAGAAAAKRGEACDAKQHAAQHEAGARAVVLAKAYDPKLPAATVGRKLTAAVLESPPPPPTFAQLAAEHKALEAEYKRLEEADNAFEDALKRVKQRRTALGQPPEYQRDHKRWSIAFHSGMDQLEAEFTETEGRPPEAAELETLMDQMQG
eukprot:7379843-Prymnesium_polylepis.1